MIREQLSEVDTMIKDYFQGNGRILVKVLVCQALLIGVLTFLCLIRPGGGLLTSVFGFLKYLLLDPGGLPDVASWLW